MRINVDFTAAIGDPTGVGTYTRELVRAMLALSSPPRLNLAIHAFRHSGWHAKVRAVLGGSSSYRVAVNRMIPHGILLETERFLRLPPAEAIFGPADVFHGTNFLVPPCSGARTVATIHDLAFVRLAGEIPVPHRYRRYIENSLDHTDHAIAVSEATRRDLIELFDFPPDRVTVVLEGGPARFPALPRGELQRLLDEWGIPRRYLLFVGTLEPRKNLPLLVRAWRRAFPQGSDRPGLVLAGRPGWHMAEIEREIHASAGAGRVVRTGFVAEDTRNSLLEGALAFVFPSRYEGFGLPVLEAFRAGVPVVASRAGAIPEVAGDAALYVEPDDEEGLGHALVKIVEDKKFAEELVQRGREQVRHFTWERAARETISVYEHVLHEMRRAKRSG